MNYEVRPVINKTNPAAPTRQPRRWQKASWYLIPTSSAIIMASIITTMRKATPAVTTAAAATAATDTRQSSAPSGVYYSY